MKLVTLDFPLPSDAQAAFSFPERTRRYRLISVCHNFDCVAGDVNVFSLLDVRDGAGGTLGFVTSDPCTGLGSNIVTFNNGQMGAAALGYGNAIGGAAFLRFGNLPPDLWLTAQMRLSIRLANASPGGSGVGTTWGSTVRLVIHE